MTFATVIWVTVADDGDVGRGVGLAGGDGDGAGVELAGALGDALSAGSLGPADAVARASEGAASEDPLADDAAVDALDALDALDAGAALEAAPAQPAAASARMTIVGTGASLRIPHPSGAPPATV